MNSKAVKTSEIKIKVGLDSNNIPVDLKWMASDSEHQNLNDCKSVNISIWDPVDNNSLGINLWTTDMRVDEMHSHYFRSLLNFTNSYHQATKNPFALKLMKEFCENLAKQTSDWEEEKK
ncbi:MAG: gliding motility protein GldC [Chitinophagales bacterium]|nr:gliding motility protein GldC [Chitinophagales bacterium]